MRLVTSVIPADVQFQAENMFAVAPEPARELPVERILNERYCLFLSPMPSTNFVQRIRVEADALVATVEEICELLRSRGRTQAVTPAARNRGVYKALIDARWNDAVAAGTPALTVQAGHMSRPILERLGFVTVAPITTLCHRFG